MDSLVFIAALAVGPAIIIWYFLNEARGSDGAFGLFALRSADDHGQNADEETRTRYRARARLTPAGRAPLHAPAGEKAYRAKPEPRGAAPADGEDDPISSS